MGVILVNTRLKGDGGVGTTGQVGVLISEGRQVDGGRYI